MDDSLDALSVEETPGPHDGAIELLIGVSRALSDAAAEQSSDEARRALTFLAADTLNAIDELEEA